MRKIISLDTEYSLVQLQTPLTEASVQEYIKHIADVLETRGIEGLSLAELKILHGQRRTIQTLLKSRRAKIWSDAKQSMKRTALISLAILAVETMAYLWLSPSLEDGFEPGWEQGKSPQGLVNEFQLQVQKMYYKQLKQLSHLVSWRFNDGPPSEPKITEWWTGYCVQLYAPSIFGKRSCNYTEIFNVCDNAGL